MIKKYQWIEKEYYNFDERSTDLYIRKLEETLENGNVNTIEEFNMMVEDASNQTLKRSYKQRIIMNNDKIIAKEPPWINAQIRSGIKKRKQLNREKRHCKDKDKKEAMEKYIHQKKKVQTDIYDAMQKYEEDLTNSIKRDTSRNKKLWQTIDKLRGKSTKAKLECKLYDCDGKLLSKEEADTEIEKILEKYLSKT